MRDIYIIDTSFLRHIHSVKGYQMDWDAFPDHSEVYAWLNPLAGKEKFQAFLEHRDVICNPFDSEFTEFISWVILQAWNSERNVRFHIFNPDVRYTHGLLVDALDPMETGAVLNCVTSTLLHEDVGLQNNIKRAPKNVFWYDWTHYSGHFIHKDEVDARSK